RLLALAPSASDWPGSVGWQEGRRVSSKLKGERERGGERERRRETATHWAASSAFCPIRNFGVVEVLERRLWSPAVSPFFFFSFSFAPLQKPKLESLVRYQRATGQATIHLLDAADTGTTRSNKAKILTRQADYEHYNGVAAKLTKPSALGPANRPQHPTPQIRDQVIAGCSSEKLRRKLLAIDNVDLEQALRVARAMETAETPASLMESNEAAVQRLRLRDTGAAASSVERLVKGPAKQQPGKQATCIRCGVPGHRTCNAAIGKTCKRCGKRNHLARACLSRPLEAVRALQADSDSSEPEDSIFCLTVAATGTATAGARTTVLVDSTQLEVLVDSGADCNILTERAWRKLPRPPQLQTTRRKVFAFRSSEPLSILGACSLQVTTGQDSQEVRFIVVPGDVERRYSQIEREALGVKFGCLKFAFYLEGCPHFDIYTNHKPLLGIYRADSRPPPRLERIMLQPQQFTFKLHYRKGEDNPADPLSRNPLPSASSHKDEAEDTRLCNAVVQAATPKCLTVDRIRAATERDPALVVVMRALATGNWSCGAASPVHSFRSLKDELSVHAGLLLRRNRIRKIWWPGMTKQVEAVVTNCLTCQAARTDGAVKQPPMQPTPLPLGAWQSLSVDAINAATADGKDWRQAIHEWLLGYRNSVTARLHAQRPHTGDILPSGLTKQTGSSGRQLQRHDCGYKQAMRKAADTRRSAAPHGILAGAHVLLRNRGKAKLRCPFDPRPWLVKAVSDDTLTLQRGTAVIRRHSCACDDNATDKQCIEQQWGQPDHLHDASADRPDHRSGRHLCSRPVWQFNNLPSDCRTQFMRTATNFYLFNLSVSDLVVLVSRLPYELLTHWHRYPFPNSLAMCVGSGFLAEMCTYCSTLTVTALTAERYCAICHPMKVRRGRGLARPVKVIASIWVASACLSTVMSSQLGFEVLVRNDTSTQFSPRVLQNSRMCEVVKPKRIAYSFLVSSLLLFVCPMIIILYMYVRIGAAVHRSLKQRKDSAGSGHSNASFDRRAVQKAQGRKTLLKLLVGIVLAFFICYAPFHLSRILADVVSKDAYCQSCVATWVNQNLFHISGLLFFGSSIVNPILYNLMSLKFRRAFRSIMMRACRRGRGNRHCVIVCHRGGARRSAARRRVEMEAAAAGEGQAIRLQLRAPAEAGGAAVSGSGGGGGSSCSGKAAAAAGGAAAAAAAAAATGGHGSRSLSRSRNCEDPFGAQRMSAETKQ
uniref:CCHC-type domain-containing protein n=1 Tax=Macrostomum lignano TaxID=282301 RepID=A0A1I8GWK9_9PLAT